MSGGGEPAEEGATGGAERPARRRWAAFLRLYPFELVALALTAVAVVFLRLQGLRIDWLTVRYTVGPMVRSVPWNLLFGVGLVVVFRLLCRRPLRAYLRRIATPGWLLLWVRLWLAAMLMGYTYFWLKVCVPLVNERLWDPQLWRLDVLLHLGFSPSVFFAEAVRGTFLAPFLDRWYAWWLPAVVYGLSFFSAFAEPAFRRSFMLSCVLLWMLGAWIYVAVPALGPVYASPEEWQAVASEMPAARGAQQVLWQNYQRMLAGRHGPLRRFNPTRGVAAMPSLHVGAFALLALWARRRARPLLAPLLAATLLTFLGSLATGWHYAVDGYAGVLLAYGCYRLARWLEPLGPEPEAAAEPRPLNGSGLRPASGSS